MSIIVVEHGAVRLMAKYVEKRKGTFYFRRRVPYDVRRLYPRRPASLFFSLKTSSQKEAVKRAHQHATEQDALWAAARGDPELVSKDQKDAALALLHAFDLKPGMQAEYNANDIEPDDFYNHLRFLSDNDRERELSVTLPPHAYLALQLYRGEKIAPTLSEALHNFQKVKGEEPTSTGGKARESAVGRFIKFAGDRAINTYERQHANDWVAQMFEQGKSSQTVRRNVNYLSPVFGHATVEAGLSGRHVFEKIHIKDTGSKKRLPFSREELIKLQGLFLDADDELRWLLALLSDTGARLAECVGLCAEDLVLDEEIPWMRLQITEARGLKNKTSERDVPLVGMARWVAHRLVDLRPKGLLFPRYLNDGQIKATHASNTLNKWIRGRDIDKTVHSFRHAVRDRLRNVDASEDLADQIGGWSNKSVGRSYGQGHSMEVKAAWMQKIVLLDPLKT